MAKDRPTRANGSAHFEVAHARVSKVETILRTVDPAAGRVMGTRSGDLDRGLGRFRADSEGMTAERFERLVNHESGLLGVSETSADVRDLMAREARDGRAAEAIALFCYAAKKTR